MQQWQEELISEMKASEKLNEKKIERMVILVAKSNHTSYQSFMYDPMILKKLYHIHKNYHNYEKKRKHYVEWRMMEVLVDTYKKEQPTEIIDYKLE